MSYLRQDMNPKTLLSEGVAIRAKGRSRLTLSLLIDESAPRELLKWVEDTFKVSDPCLTFDIRTFSTEHLGMKKPSDLAIVVAGDSTMVGPTAAIVDAGGTPVVVLATQLDTVMEQAKQVGFPLEEDQVLLYTGSDRKIKNELGSWISSKCDEALAFSRIFPFVRRSTTSRMVRAASFQNAVIGFIPLIPGADFPTMTYNQLTMLMKEETAFGENPDLRTLLVLAFCVGGALGCRTVARTLCKAYPAYSMVIKAACGGLATLAVGEGTYLFLEKGWGKERLDVLQKRLLKLPARLAAAEGGE